MPDHSHAGRGVIGAEGGTATRNKPAHSGFVARPLRTWRLRRTVEGSPRTWSEIVGVAASIGGRLISERGIAMLSSIGQAIFVRQSGDHVRTLSQGEQGAQ